MRIVLHIDRLVVDGPPNGTASLGDVGEIVRAELASLLAGAPVAPSAGAFREVPAPPAAAGPGGPSEGIGRSIARAVHGALGGRP
jgi:hypothetical protein